MVVILGIALSSPAVAGLGDCAGVSAMYPSQPNERAQIKRRIDDAIAEVADKEWSAFQPYWWALEAEHLLGLALSVGPPKPAPPAWPCLRERTGWRWGDVEWRRSMFGLYLQISRSTASLGSMTPPLFATVNAVPVEYFGWMAGVMAWQDRTLVTTISGAEAADLRTMVAYHVGKLESGAYGEVPRFVDEAPGR